MKDFLHFYKNLSATPDDKKRQMFGEGSSRLKLAGPALIAAAKDVNNNVYEIFQNFEIDFCPISPQIAQRTFKIIFSPYITKK